MNVRADTNEEVTPFEVRQRRRDSRSLAGAVTLCILWMTGVVVWYKWSKINLWAEQAVFWVKAYL